MLPSNTKIVKFIKIPALHVFYLKKALMLMYLKSMVQLEF